MMISENRLFTHRENELFQSMLIRTGDKERLLSWANAQQIEKSCKIHDWTQLIKGKVNRITDVASMPLQDHARMYQRYDGSRVFISQPYLTKSDVENSAKLKEWTNIRGLKLSLISEELSWHYPGSTVLFQIEIEDEDLYLSYIKENRGSFSII